MKPYAKGSILSAQLAAPAWDFFWLQYVLVYVSQDSLRAPTIVMGRMVEAVEEVPLAQTSTDLVDLALAEIVVLG